MDLYALKEVRSDGSVRVEGGGNPFRQRNHVHDFMQALLWIGPIRSEPVEDRVEVSPGMQVGEQGQVDRVDQFGV